MAVLPERPEVANNPNTNHPWLSVIIPIYNAQKYLEQCLQSILSQSFGNYEVLLMDDGSTDQTPIICRSFASKNPRVKYYPKENTGCFHNRLSGFYKATGDYCTTIDADDFLLSDNVFEILYRTVQENNCDMLQFGRQQIYRHLRRCSHVKQEEYVASYEDFHKIEYIKLFGLFTLDQHLFVSIHGKLFSRRLLDHLPPLSPVERLFLGEDVVLNLYLLENCQSALFLQQQFYGYRETSGGTKRFSKAAMQDLDKVSAHKLRFLARISDLDANAIEYRIFADIAGSLLAYVQDALLNVSKEDTERLLNEALSFPRFQLAKDYFFHHPEYDWTGVKLLRNGNPNAYIEEALKRNQKNRMRRSIKAILKKVYSSI